MNSPWHHLLTYKEIPCPVRLHLLVVEQESSSHWHWLLAPGELVNVEMAVTDQCLCSMCSQPCQASCFPHVSAICSLQLISWWSTRTAVVWSTALCDTAALMSHLLQVLARAVSPPSTAASPAHKGALLALHGSQRVQSPGSWGRVISPPSVGGWISLAIAWDFTRGTLAAAQQACYMQIRQKSHLIVHEMKTDPQVEVAGSGSWASLTGALLLHPNANAISTASSSTIPPLMWLSDLFRWLIPQPDLL